jgi:hypothetical protein
VPVEQLSDRELYEIVSRGLTDEKAPKVLLIPPGAKLKT